MCVGAQYLKHEFDLYFMWKRTVFGKEDTKIELEAFLCKGKRCRLTDYFKGVSFDETSILYIWSSPLEKIRWLLKYIYSIMMKDGSKSFVESRRKEEIEVIEESLLLMDQINLLLKESFSMRKKVKSNRLPKFRNPWCDYTCHYRKKNYNEINKNLLFLA